MRRESAINLAKRLRLVETARRMSPEERLAACVNLAKIGAEIQQAGEEHRGKDRGERRAGRR